MSFSILIKSLLMKKCIFHHREIHVPRDIFSWTGKMVFEGGLCLPRAVFTAPSEARAVIRPKGGKGRPRRPFCLSMKKYPWDMIFAGDDDTLFPFESHSTFLASFWTKIGQNRSKSVKNRTKIGSKSDKNSFFIISRSCRPF